MFHLKTQLKQKPVMRNEPAPAAFLRRDDWKKLRRWYQTHRRRLPWRVKSTPWSVLLAETLLHRTRANIVANIYPGILQEFPSVRHVLANKRSWMRVTRTLGLSWRAKEFVSACTVLAEKNGS